MAHLVDALWQDIFYRDQRIGGWLSGLEQSLDLIGPISMQAVNSDYFYSLLLKWRKNYPDARVDVLQRLIIARCALELESLPINPPLDKR